MAFLTLLDNEELTDKTFDAIDMEFDYEKYDILIHVKGDNVKLDKLRIQNFKKDLHRLIRIDGKNCVISNSVFTQLEGDYPVIVLERKDRLDEPDNLMIYNCLFYGINKLEDKNGNEIIRLGWSGSSLLGKGNCVIHKCRFENIKTEIEVISVKCNENIFTGNKFINNTGTLTLRHGKNSIVYANEFDGKNNKKGGGVRVCDTGHIIKDNRFKNINSNDTTRTCISVNNGKPKSKLNEYMMVEELSILDNYFDNCETALALGLEIKSYSSMKPGRVYIKGNNFSKVNNICSTNKKVKGVNEGITENNVFKDSNLGAWYMDKSSESIRHAYTIKYNPMDTADKLVNYQDYLDFIFENKEEEKKEEIGDEVDEIDVDINNYENNVLNKLMGLMKVQYKLKRFNELKEEIEEKQAELKCLMNEMFSLMKV